MPDPRPSPPPGRPFESLRERKTEPDPEAQKRAAGWARTFGLVLLVAVGLSLLALPWPLPILTAAVCMATMALGVVALVQVRSAGVGGGTTAAVVAGLAVSAFLTMTASGQVLLWREYSAYAECMESAITEQAQDMCQAALERSLDERLQQMQQMLSTS